MCCIALSVCRVVNAVSIGNPMTQRDTPWLTALVRASGCALARLLWIWSPECVGLPAQTCRPGGRLAARTGQVSGGVRGCERVRAVSRSCEMVDMAWIGAFSRHPLSRCE
eukprot:TRINITY_DN71995_c0_g1_i1.p2 TRINITY_DN71995_c0_g1~~TRINITY_DN71995_c0_g1_i1.p2  ORF type:complete len:110 (+),score=11.89 TRINITY_DN71995_c0_g1_i1:135-464(+)